jgi:aerobic carbon-monoxide dehydrogenase large subunit
MDNDSNITFDLELCSDPDQEAHLIGKSVPRLNDARLLSGNGKYVDDIQVPGMWEMAIKRSDQAYAKIRSIDTSAAKQLEGVKSVFVYQDIAHLVKPIKAVSKMADYLITEVFVLANEYVRYVGQPVVVVIAENRYIAEDACDLINIDYEALPVATDLEIASKDESPNLYDSLNTNVILKRTFAKGDVDNIFQSADVVLQERFRFRRKTSIAMENRGYLAQYDVGQDAITLYTSSQVPGIIRDAIAYFLDLNGSQIHVEAPDIGGGFGGKTSLYQEEILVCLFARLHERSIKWISDRLEDFMSTSQGFDELIDAKIAANVHGQIVALQAEVLSDIGAYSIYPWTASIEPVQVVSFMPGPYKISAYRGSVQGICTPKPPMGPYRGVGRPISTFVMERLIDLLAVELKMDPYQLRLINLVQPGDFPYKSASGLVWDQSAFLESLQKAAQHIQYEAFRKDQVIAKAQGKLVGIGIATYAELSGIGSKISASPGMPINTGTDTCVMSLDSTGAITAAFGSCDYGQGHVTTLAQVVSEYVGAKISDIKIVSGDSKYVPHGTGSYASRTAVISSGAGILAAQELQARIKRMAAYLFSVTPEEIQVRLSKITDMRAGQSITFKEFATVLYAQMGRIPANVREELSVTKVYDPIFGTTSSGTHIAQVEVDPVLLSVKILRYVVVEDCGQIINPMIVDGQIRGGVMQGIGAALYEEVIHNEDGQLLTVNLVDYLVPTAVESINVEIVHLQTIASNTLGGFRGMGEGGTIGAPAAIANAVSDALSQLNIKITELPITPNQLYQKMYS